MYKYKIHLHIWAILPAALLASVLHTQHCTYTLAQIAEDHCKKKKKHIFIIFFWYLGLCILGENKVNSQYRSQVVPLTGEGCVSES